MHCNSVKKCYQAYTKTAETSKLRVFGRAERRGWKRGVRVEYIRYMKNLKKMSIHTNPIKFKLLN